MLADRKRLPSFDTGYTQLSFLPPLSSPLLNTGTLEYGQITTDLAVTSGDRSENSMLLLPSSEDVAASLTGEL